ncbi:hypothetical protein [Methyloceanibacter methanicus]|nr:hypothetical protein [Methyloceanibacter methanicus]
MLKMTADSIVFSSRGYRRNECGASGRRQMIHTIGLYDRDRRRFPDAKLPNAYSHELKGPLTEYALKAEISALFAEGLLTLDDFKQAPRAWLETFVRPGGSARARQLKQCQAEG